MLERIGSQSSLGVTTIESLFSRGPFYDDDENPLGRRSGFGSSRFSLSLSSVGITTGGAIVSRGAFNP
ncbi:hypothetical protein KKE78_00500 [Patescibacteria group bacterium]|nr:hypothetical protein [Patescibacteria group bacterium]